MDTSGDMQFPAMRRLSIATAHAFLLVYSVTSAESFTAVKQCFEEIREQRADFQVKKAFNGGRRVSFTPAAARQTQTILIKRIDEDFNDGRGCSSSGFLIERFSQEIPIVIAGNKSDLVETHREVRIEDVSEWVYCELPKLKYFHEF